MDKCTISISSTYLRKEILGVQLKSKLESCYREQLNAHFLGVDGSWKQVRDKWSKMKDKYETERKKTQVIGASLSNWPWFERFDQMFESIAKINGIPNAIDKGVQNLHSQGTNF